MWTIISVQLCDLTSSCFNTIPVWGRHTHRHRQMNRKPIAVLCLEQLSCA